MSGWVVLAQHCQGNGAKTGTVAVPEPVYVVLVCAPFFLALLPYNSGCFFFSLAALPVLPLYDVGQFAQTSPLWPSCVKRVRHLWNAGGVKLRSDL